MLKDAFTRHPASVGETYFEHLRAALGFAGPLALAAMVCLVHAVLPFLFDGTGSRIVRQLHDRMGTHRVALENRHKVVPAAAE